MPSTTKTQNLNEFALFPELPLELRLKVWRTTLPGPRIVTILLSEQNGQMIGTSSAKIPQALHVSSEARKEARRFYKLAFASKPDDELVRDEASDENSGNQEATIWFNFAIDLLYIPRSVRRRCNYRNTAAFETLSSHISDLSDLKYVAIDFRLLYSFCNSAATVTVKDPCFDCVASTPNAYMIYAGNQPLPIKERV